MALKIRLARHGAKKRPHYAIVVADARAPRDGKYIEKVGRYNPMVAQDHADRLVLVEDRIKYWLSQGAQATDRVERFLSLKGVIGKYELVNQTKKSNPKAKAQERLKAEEEAKLKREEEAQAAKEAAKAEKEAAEAKASEAPAENNAEAPADASAESAE